MSPQTLTRGRRLLTGTTVAALTAGVLAFTPTTAQAATGAPSLAWKISDQFDNHLSTHTLENGATESADGVVTFGNGIGTHASDTGITKVAYEGSVTGAFVNGGNTFYSVTIANPEVQIDETGEGKIVADVSSVQNVAQGPTSPAGSTEPTRVTVTTFDATATDWAFADGLKSLTDTPDWAGVLEPGSQGALDLGITDPARPVDGKSFAPEFLGALMPGTRAHFHWTTGSDAKAPAPFTATSRVAAVTATADATVGSLKVEVNGTGYSKSGVGIYVALAVSGSFDPLDASNYLGTKWLTAGMINADGTFATELVLSPEEIARLDPTANYSVYTMKAHGQAVTDTSQTAEFPVEIDFAALNERSAPLSVTGLTTMYGKGGTVRVKAPVAGQVSVAGLGTKNAAAGATVAFTVSKRLTAGTRNLTVSLVPTNADIAAPAATTVRVSIAKANVGKRAVKVTKKPTTRKKGKAVVRVAGVKGASVPTGKVRIKLTKGKKSKYVTTSVRGNRTITLPKLAKGKWTVRVAYYGNANYTPRGYAKVGTVKVTKK